MKLLKQVIPLVVILGSIIFFAAILVPSVTEIFDNLGEIESKRNQSKKLIANLDSMILDRKNISKYSSLLSSLNNTTVTKASDILDFRNKIFYSAQKAGLQVLTEKISELDLNSSGSSISNDNWSISLREVPIGLQLAGKLTDLINFIKEIESYPELLIIKEMKLSQNVSSNSDDWNMDILVSRFSFPSLQKLDLNYLDVDYNSLQISKPVEAFLTKEQLNN